MISKTVVIFFVLTCWMAVSADAMSLNMFEEGNLNANLGFNFKVFSQQMKELSDKMENLQNEMQENLQQMEVEKSEMSKKMEEYQLLDERNLTVRIQPNGTDSVYNFGGCFCKNFKCECCGLVDELSEKPTCYILTYLKNTTSINILSMNETFGELSSLSLKDVCDEKVCLHFYNVIHNSNTNSFKGCVDIELVENKSVKVRLGCFRMENDTQKFTRNLMSVHSDNKTIFYNQMNEVVNSKDMNGLDMGMFVNFSRFGGFNSIIMNVNVNDAM